MQSSIRVLVACMLLTSFITHTVDINSPNLILSRMTFSDVFGVLAIIIGISKKIMDKSWATKIPPVYTAAVVVVFCLALSFFTSLSPKSTVFEILILCYLVLLSYVIFEAYKLQIHLLIKIIVTMSFFTFAIGLYDVLAVNRDWPTIFPNVNSIHGGSSFRYFGQAANYGFTMLSILIPLKYSDISKMYSVRQKNFLNGTIVLGLLFLISTGRISILISFLVAALLFIVYTRKLQIVKDIGYGILVIAISVVLGRFLIPDLVANIQTRFEHRISQRESGNLASEFIVDNFLDTFVSFFDNPVFGSGLGGFANNYSEYEIHGTYFKMIGEAGLIGILGYLFFIILFIRMCIKTKSSFFYYFLPFLMGSLVSWGYNYHLRKKEFWILCAFFAILQYVHINKNNLKTQKKL